MSENRGSPDPAAQSASAALLEGLERIRANCVEIEREHAQEIDQVQPPFRDSARNLLHYLALRKHDLRGIQAPLAALGLSSLGRSEAYVLANLDAVMRILRLICGDRRFESDSQCSGVTLERGHELLDRHAASLLGPSVTGRDVRIMVTLPGEAADNIGLVRSLMQAGMTCARINTAHDSPEAWERMSRNVRHAARDLGVPCRILMDLAGPKLRTAAVELGPAVIKWRPTRDELGQVTHPAMIRIRAAGTPEAGSDAVDLPVDPTWLAGLWAGDTIELCDARGRERQLTVIERGEGFAMATCDRTAYVVPGTPLRLHHAGPRHHETRVLDLPAAERVVLMRLGDRVLLSRSAVACRPAEIDESGRLLQPAVVACTLPDAVDDVREGESVWFDDGRAGGVVRAVSERGLEVEITSAPPAGIKLRSDKGLNFPESTLRIAALSPEDLACLPLVSRCADLVGMSFVREAADVEDLQVRLAEVGGGHIALVLKIETRRAFENLPGLLLAAMRSPAAGVMIARGDLAVECGYARLAEVQEEILWLCEAAHTPVIWATQVLETLAKTGQPSRAEVTDAAMSERAECVMLNKGPYIIEAARFLDGVLRRMQEHQWKKRPMLRALSVAQRFGASGAEPT